MAKVTQKPIWLTSENAAEYIGVEPGTLDKWRSRRTCGNGHRPPKSYKVGGKVGYRQADLDRWLEANSSE